MAPSRPLLLQQRARIALLWLLAALVPLQCGAAVARLVAGPVHGHTTAAGSVAATIPLQDFRRLAPSRSAHAHVQGERHHHALGDATVVAIDDVFERTSAGDEDAGSAGSAFAALLPLASAPCPWQAGAVTDPKPDTARWWASSGSGCRLERPPRLAQA